MFFISFNIIIPTSYTTSFTQNTHHLRICKTRKKNERKTCKEANKIHLIFSIHVTTLMAESFNEKKLSERKSRITIVCLSENQFIPLLYFNTITIKLAMYNALYTREKESTLTEYGKGE